jgi:hypothetical protein
MKDLRRSFHRIFHHSSHLSSRRSSRRSSLLSSLLSSRRSSHQTSRKDAVAAFQVVKAQQLTQTAPLELEAEDVLVGINSIPVHQLDVQVAIVHQYCYTVKAQLVFNLYKIGE